MRLKPFIVAVLLLSGCVSVSPDALNVEKLYRKDMELKIDGQKITDGVYVLPKKPAYKITAYLYRKAQIFKITSCHREWVWQAPGDDIDFVYEPIKGIEDTGLCPLEIGGFDLKGQHSWAYIDFAGSETLTAEIGCNGHIAQHNGVSICQCRKGLIQRITFREKVKGYSVERCGDLETQDNKTFQVIVSPSKCVYLFKNSDGAEHRLTTIGYDDIMLRE